METATRTVSVASLALDFDPQHKGALEYLGELYVETGQVDKAKENVAALLDAVEARKSRVVLIASWSVFNESQA